MRSCARRSTPQPRMTSVGIMSARGVQPPLVVLILLECCGAIWVGCSAVVRCVGGLHAMIEHYIRTPTEGASRVKIRRTCQCTRPATQRGSLLGLTWPYGHSYIA